MPSTMASILRRLITNFNSIAVAGQRYAQSDEFACARWHLRQQRHRSVTPSAACLWSEADTEAVGSPAVVATRTATRTTGCSETADGSAYPRTSYASEGP